ncbi:ABC transporter permease [Conexivisphaera calida]|uniref:ABC-type multidrug transport system, permease component n=1 Tax=Conexivisphaera calida TaxID=1874277 RepID=A0A4V0P1M5_9ARCH|nr:ABC transporter permease [Conexivisphaera calida]BBE42240.1 ABC-type multidrug transport system, permease component [Conexivisphaera calida]
MGVLSKLYAYLYLRGFRVWASYRTQAVLTMLSWVLPVFTYYFTGTALGNQLVSKLGMGAGNYTSFFVVGLAFQGYVSSTIATVSQRLRNEQLYGTLEYYVLSPSGVLGFLVYSSIWGFALNSVSAAVILAVGAALGVRFLPSGMLAASMMIALLMISTFGIAAMSGAVVMVTKQGNPISFFFSTFTTLMGGVVFPAAALPWYLRYVSYGIPLTWALEGLRGALLYGEGLWELLPFIAVLAVFAAVTVPLGLLSYRLAFDRARRDGTLSQY